MSAKDISVRWPTINVNPASHLLSISSEQLIAFVNQYLVQEGVQQFLGHRIESVYLPMARWLLNKLDDSQPLIIGINGAQGSGKSTLAGLLQLIFEQGYGLNIAKLSIDDLYLGKKSRQQLADTIHPLLKTREIGRAHV